jgi:hypothetical protein
MYATMSGASGTVTRRGLSKVDAWTEVAGNKFIHNRSASVKVTNLSLVLINRLLLGTDTFNAPDWTGVNSISGLATPTSSETTKAANVAYANALAIAGAPDASTTVKGIVEEATQAEVAAGTAAGSTSARLFTNPSTLAPHVQSGAWIYAVEDGVGGDDTYTATVTPSLTTYTAGMVLVVKITIANTAAATLNINSLGAKAIKKYVAGAKVDIETGDIIANQICRFVYDGTDMILISPIAAMPTTANLQLVTSAIPTLAGGSTTNADSFHTHTLIPSFFTAYLNYGTISGAQIKYAQFCLNADKSYGYFIHCHGASPDIYVYRFVRDANSKAYIYDGTNTALLNSTYGWNGGASIVAGSTYVWAIGYTGTDRKIVRMAADLTSPTVMTMSGSADATTPIFAGGTDSLLYIQKNTTTILQYSISGTTATRGSDITLTSGGNVTDFDGTNFYSYLASTNTLKKYSTAGGAATTTAVKYFANSDNQIAVALDEYAVGLCSLDSTRMYLVTGRLIDSATAGKDGFALDFTLVTKI